MKQRRTDCIHSSPIQFNGHSWFHRRFPSSVAFGDRQPIDERSKQYNNIESWRFYCPRKKIAETNHETEAKQCDLCVPFIIYQFSRYGDGRVSRSSAFASQYIVVVDVVLPTNGSGGGSAKSVEKLFSVAPRATSPILK